MDLTHIKPGDRLLVVRPAERNRQGAEAQTYDAIVTKVGRLYLEATRAEDVEKGVVSSVFSWKIERRTGREKSDYMPTRAFTDRAAWELYQKRKGEEHWAYRLASNVSERALSHLTDTQLLTLTAIIKAANDAEKAAR